MTVFMPAGYERLLPSLKSALVRELGLHWISGAFSPSDVCLCIPGITWILRATHHLSASCSYTLASPFGDRYKERVSTDLNLLLFTPHTLSSNQPLLLLPSFSFAHCADPYNPVGCSAFEAEDSGRLERNHRLDLTPMDKSPEDGTGAYTSQSSQSSSIHSRFCVNSFSCIG